MRITIINILISLLYFGLAGCEKKEEMIPSDITNLQTQSSPGQISLYWELPSDETIRYTKVSYYDKLQGKEVTRQASIYSDSLLIPNTRKKYGTYSFTVQPFSYTDTGGKVQTIEATSEAAPITVEEKSEQIKLSANDLSTNAQEPSEGSIENLLDNNTATYFHTAWSISVEAPHWMQINLKQTVDDHFKFYYAPRNNASNKPTDFDLMGSKDGINWFLIKNFTQENDGLPITASDDYTSPVIKVSQPFSYIRLIVNKTNNNTVYWTMSEFKFYNVIRTIIDPEAPDAEI